MRARPSAFAASVGRGAGASRAGRATVAPRHGRRAKVEDPQPRNARGRLKKPYPVWLVTTAAFVLPGSGQWLNGDPTRGAVMQFFMMLLAYMTYMMSTPQTSFVGRFAGGFLVWIFAIIDANGIAKRRVKAWDRMTRDDGQSDFTGRPKPAANAPVAVKPARAAATAVTSATGAATAAKAVAGTQRKARPAKTRPRSSKAPSAAGRSGADSARRGGVRPAKPRKAEGS